MCGTQFGCHRPITGCHPVQTLPKPETNGRSWRVRSVVHRGLGSFGVFAVGVGLSLLWTVAVAGRASAETTQLFNGKNLEGWYADVPEADNNPDVRPSFIVRDGNLVSRGVPRGHLITEKSYQDYRLEIEYRFPGEPGNCGVLVHTDGQRPRVLSNMFPASLEVQLKHESAGDFWCIHENIKVPNMRQRRKGSPENWGGKRGQSRHIVNLTDDSEKPLGQWNRMTIECLGDKIRVWVNGDLVNDGYDCTATEGQIALQAEGSEVEFRKLALTPIKQLSPPTDK